MDASAVNENKWRSMLSMDASAINENGYVLLSMDASAINENKWISIVKYGCQCNKMKKVDKYC